MISFSNDEFPEHPGCNGTTFDEQYSVLGAAGCESVDTGIAAPNNVKQMYTSCSVSGNQITGRLTRTLVVGLGQRAS